MIKRLILSISLVLVMCFTFILNTNSIEVKAENKEVSLSIYKNNLSYSSEIYFLYSLQYENIDIEKNSIELLFWDSVQEKYLKGTESYSKKSVALEEIDEKMCLVYYSEGIDAKNIVDELYTRAYVKIDEVEYYSDVDVTSVVEYVYRMKKTGELSDTLNNLFDALLDYGAAAQLKFEYKTDTLANELIKEVKVVNGLVNEKQMDVFYQDYNATIKALDKTSEGLLFKYWTDSEGNIVSYESEYCFEVLDNETYTANYIEASKVSEGLVLSEELFYDEGLDIIDLPSAVLVEKGDEAYILDIEWDTSTFIKNSIGEQTLYASLVDKSAYEEFGINEGDIKAVLTVLPYTMILASDNESYIITKYYGNETDVIIPTTAKNLSVTGIDGYGFSLCDSIETVVIPETITSLGSRAFEYCSSLRSVEIKSDLQSLLSNTFNDCINLKNVILPETITVISGNAFDGCSSLEEIDLPSNLITLGSSAFRGCSSLLNITIPNGVTQIPDYLFYNCSNLINVELGDNVINIGWYSFYNCESLEAIVLPSSLRSISYEAFYGCSTLQSVTMGNNIASIGSGTFGKNSSLSDVYFNGTLEDWCSMEFYSYLSNPIAPLSATLHLLGEDGEYFVPERIVVPETIVQINPYAFYNCKDIKYLTIDPSVNKIKSDAFYNCNNLKEIYYNGTLEEWNSIAFSNGNANPLNNGAKLITKESIDDEEVNQTVFNIKYNLEGGESSLELPSTYKMTDDTYTLPTKEEMYKEDYEFYGWYSNKDMLGGAITEISSGSIGDIELFTVWVSSESVLVELSDADREIIQNYKPNKFVIADLGASKYEINGHEYLFGVDIFNNINDALSKSSEYDVIYVFAGEYELFSDIRKSVTILGPNADKGSQEERNEEALVTIFYDQVDTFAANVRFNGLSLNGNNEPTDTGIYFQCRVGTEEFTLESCIINHGNTFIKVVSGSDMTINVLNSRISQIGQFLVWSLDGTTSNVNIKGNYYSGHNCGTLGSEITSQIRVLSGNTYVYNNVFLGDLLKATYGGYFSNRGSGEFLVKYNTFVYVTKYVCLTNLTSMVFDNNLYINSDAVSTSSPVDGITNVTKDTTLATSLENLESIYKESEDYFCSKHDKEFNDFKAATCTESGHNSYQTCKNCDYSTYEVINALGHDEVEHEGKDATCTETGHKAYVTCTRCDYTTYEVIDALGHDEVEHEGKDATCEETGYKAYVTCIRCDYSTYEVINALGHDEVEHEGKDATCTESGHKAYVTCTRCDYTTYEEIDALGHDEVENEGKDATCTETGYKAYVTCTRCDYSTYEVIDALGHDEVENEGKDATCTETGYKAYVTCTRCDYSTYEVINALGHDEVEHAAKDATCTESGHKAYVTCTRCDYTTYEEIDSLGHDEVEHEGKDATCTETGYKAYVTCTRCDYSTYEEIEALGHKYSIEWTIDQKPTETSIGLKSHHCKNEGCESKIDITEIPMLPYSDGLEYELNSTSDGYIVKGRGSCYDSIINITPVYNGLPVVKIGDEAFSEYWLLSKIIIPSSVESIGYGAFASCDALKTVVIQDGSINIGDYAFRDCTSLTSLTIPSSVESVGKGAFIRCTSLESATIQEGVISIGESAFASCESLINITIPSSVESIGDDAFFRCISLENLTIQEGVISIGDGVFRNCTALASITIPLSVENIGELAFSYCKSLTSIEIPSSVTSIGDSAFYSCDALKTVVIQDGLINIGDSAFDFCKSLTSIEIPSSVTAIGDSAFSSCRSLIRVYYNGTIADWCNITFSNNYSNPMSYASNFHMLDETDVYYSVKEIVIPSYIESIGNYVFSGFKSITNIIIPSSVTAIGDSAFRDCTSLKSIEIPSSVTSIGDSAFYSCELLTSIEIPSSVTSIGDSAFYSCESLTSIEIPSSVTTIGNSAFEYCSSLTSIEIPSSVTAIGDSAFSFCESLTSIEIPSSVTSIGDSAFRACALLKSIEIPSSVTTIGKYAFEYCASLTSIEIPSSVTAIGNSAFDSCTTLTSVYYSGTVEEANNISLSTKFEDTVTIYYYSETEPSVEGNYWYYDENRQIKVWG